MALRRSARIAGLPPSFPRLSSASSTSAASINRNLESHASVKITTPFPNTPSSQLSSTQSLQSPSRRSDRNNSDEQAHQDAAAPRVIKKTKLASNDDETDIESLAADEQELTFMSLPAEIRRRVYDFLFEGCVWTHADNGWCGGDCYDSDCGHEAKGRKSRVSLACHLNYPSTKKGSINFALANPKIINDLAAPHLSTFLYSREFEDDDLDLEISLRSMPRALLEKVQHLRFEFRTNFFRRPFWHEKHVQILREEFVPRLVALKSIKIHYRHNLDKQYGYEMNNIDRSPRGCAPIQPQIITGLFQTDDYYWRLTHYIWTLRYDFMQDLLNSPLLQTDFILEFQLGCVWGPSVPYGAVMEGEATGKAGGVGCVVSMKPSMQIAMAKQAVLAQHPMGPWFWMDEGSVDWFFPHRTRWCRSSRNIQVL